MASLRLALFDCDGTLVDSQHLIVRAALDAWQGLALPPPTPAAIRHVVGLSLDDAMARLAPGIAPSLQARLAERYRRHYTGLLADGALEAPLFPGTVAALDRLADDGVLLGIATGKSRRGLEETLQAHDLGGRFVTLQTADRARGKPDPDMVLRAAAETGVDPGAIAVIGDTAYDMAMARAGGARAIGVAWGYHAPEALDAAGAELIARSFDDVPAAVARLLPPVVS